MDQNKLRKLAGLATISENADLRNNANFQARMQEKFEDISEKLDEIIKFTGSTDFDKFSQFFDGDEAEENYDLHSSLDHVIFQIREDLRNAQFAMNSIYHICSGTNPT